MMMMMMMMMMMKLLQKNMLQWMRPPEVKYSMADNMFVFDSENKERAVIQSPSPLSKGKTHTPYRGQLYKVPLPSVKVKLTHLIEASYTKSLSPQ